MAGKRVVRGSADVAFCVDCLSKNTLADILLDRVTAEIGEDATDEQILTFLQSWVNPVQRLRGDKPVELLTKLAYLKRKRAEYQRDVNRYDEQNA